MGRWGWMADRMAWRGNPSALWPEARSIIMLAESYTPDHNPLDLLALREHGVISVYAQGRDYHDVVKKRLKRLGRWLIERAGGEIKVFVDTAPVNGKNPWQKRRDWAGRASTQTFLSRDLGNWFFLGAIFTTHALPTDTPAEGHCGVMPRLSGYLSDQCLPPHPTSWTPGAAFLTMTIDTIRWAVQKSCARKWANRFDWAATNLRALARLSSIIYIYTHRERECVRVKYMPPVTENPGGKPMRELAGLDDAGFAARFSGSARIKRIGRGRFVRNVLYAIGNSGSPRLRPVAQGLCDDADAVVADAAQWAVARLA